MLENKLKELIIEKFGSVRQFSFKIDIPYTTVDSILKRGLDNSNVGNVIKMCKALDISIDYLLDNKEIVSNLKFDNAELIDIEDTVKIPVLGVIKAGIPIEAQENIIEYVEIPKSWTKGEKKFYGLKISGDSMFPRYHNEDTVIFEQNNDFVLANNKDCAVMVNGDDATFKKVMISEKGVTLIPYNIEYEPLFFTKEDVENLPVKIIGIAREKRSIID